MTSKSTATPFFISDTSPLFAYSPCVDCAASGSWQAGYKPRGDGFDQTFHEAIGDGAIVAVNVTATTLRFYTSSSSLTSPNNQSCPTQYSLNGSTWLDACTSSGSGDGFMIANLPRGLHRVELRTKSSGAGLQFEGVGGELDLRDEGGASNMTIDNTSPSFLYNPANAWSSIGPDGAIGQVVNVTVGSTLGNMTGFYNQTVGVSTDAGARAELTFQGQAIYVYGLTGPEGGTAEVHLDGELQQTLNMTTKWPLHSSLLYMGSGFNVNETHTLSITNTSPGRQMVIDYATLTTPYNPSSSSSSSHLPLLIGLISGISALVLILGVIAYIWYSRRRRRATEHRLSTQTPYPFSSGIGNDSSSLTSKHSQFDEMIPYSPPHTGGTTALQRTGGGFAWGIGGASSRDRSPSARSPPPDYPDYLPYRGPVERSPPSSDPPDGESTLPYTRAQSPPLIAGATPSATGWLSSRSAAAAAAMREERTTTPSTPSTARSGNGRSRDARSPIALISRRGGTNRSTDGYDEIALDKYERNSASPTHLSTPSSLSAPSLQELAIVPTRAVGGSRSVAKLWPSRDAVPSTFRTISVAQTPTPAGSSAVPSSKLVPSSRKPGSQYTTSATPITTPIPPSQSTSAPTYPDPYPEQHDTNLRRGVSIKSIKTMRSFFSGLLFVPPSSNTSPVPTTPALPQTAARPDSDIFPGQGQGVREGSIKSDRAVLPPSAFVAPTPISGVRQGRGGSGDMGQYKGHVGQSGDVSPDRKGEGLGLIGIEDERETTKPHAYTGTSRRSSRSISHHKDLSLDLALTRQGGENDDTSPNLFIELDPNSPVTAHWPDSQWVRGNGGMW